jgi:hypothetical protein
MNDFEIFITYLLRPRETVCFVDQRSPLLSEAKLRATTAVEGPQNTLLSRYMYIKAKKMFYIFSAAFVLYEHY